MPASRQDFLTRGRAFAREPLGVDGFEGYFVREVSAAEAKEYTEKQRAKGADDLGVAAWLVVRVVCDAEGRPVLTGDDVEAVKELRLSVLKAVGEAAAKVSGWDKGGAEDAKKN